MPWEVKFLNNESYYFTLVVLGRNRRVQTESESYKLGPEANEDFASGFAVAPLRPQVVSNTMCGGTGGRRVYALTDSERVLLGCSGAELGEMGRPKRCRLPCLPIHLHSWDTQPCFDLEVQTDAARPGFGKFVL